MGKELHVHVGDRLDEIGARAVFAWHRMERGDQVDEKHISFESWETMVRVELLRHIHQHPAKNIRALSITLGRNYRRVHEDVAALEAAGLLDGDKDGLRAEYDAFDVSMKVAL